MKLKEIIELVDGELLTPEADIEMDIPCGFASDLISDILMCTKEPTLLFTGLTNPQVIRLADMIDLIAIVFVRGKRPNQDLIEMAQERNVPLVVSQLTMFNSVSIVSNSGLRSCLI